MGANQALALLKDKVTFDLGSYIVREGRIVAVDIDRLIADGYGPMIREVWQTEQGPRIKFVNQDEAHRLVLQHLGLLEQNATGKEIGRAHV